MHSRFRVQGLGISILFLRIAAELNRAQGLGSGVWAAEGIGYKD